MRIPCPYCGWRDLVEFSVLGEVRPTPATLIPASNTEQCDAAADALYLRDNPAGPHQEWWYHAAGCQSWLCVTRDTRTHEVLGAQTALELPR